MDKQTYMQLCENIYDEYTQALKNRCECYVNPEWTCPYCIHMDKAQRDFDKIKEQLTLY